MRWANVTACTTPSLYTILCGPVTFACQILTHTLTYLLTYYLTYLSFFVDNYLWQFYGITSKPRGTVAGKFLLSQGDKA